MSPESHPPSTTAARSNESRRQLRTGLAQLSLVEHALCQLDTRESLRPAQRFETGFFYSDDVGDRQFAEVLVGAAFGFSPADDPVESGTGLSAVYYSAAQRGRFDATKKYGDKGKFSVPSLRNGRTYYRLQYGTTSQAHSEILCQRMRIVGQSCVVVGLGQ